MRTVLVCTVLALAACAPAHGQDDGNIPENGSVSPFDNDNPAIRNLDPQLRAAVQQAAQDARRRVEFKVTSGWRSKDYQQHLLDQAVARYGSLGEARKFVNTPEKSTHVSGKAVDIGPTNAADWLVQHGAKYGLCQVYSNEMWHFELLTAPGGDCPPLRSDAAG
jgi:LAS superfamily LD-carboxypeptidase LdcB